ncbi:hypothetical protein Srufu_079650 (plasmid) [Streptomyces libani subsp. rufus]|nr:hypothetical protein Srufu_079650 [Streptomyces libani subsp. rufus]
MAKLVRSVFVRDPARHRDILLNAGEEPAPEYAALVTNPACWEDGKLPTPAKRSAEGQSTPDPPSDDDEGDKPAAKKAATRPARGRKSADEGDS